MQKLHFSVIPFLRWINVRIQSFLVFFRPGGRIPVEITDRVRTIGDAHPNTDAPGIDLSHNSFRVLVGGLDGADLCAGRSIAMHAGHGNEAHLHVRVGSFNLRDEVHPKFGPPEFGLRLTAKAMLFSWRQATTQA